MSRAVIVTTLLALARLAHADEPHADEPRAEEPPLALVPSCAAIDAEHDALPAADREAARRLLVRALEHADLLVVDSGCVDHYTVAHDVEGDTLTIHVHGPRGRRRMRQVNRADLFDDYVHMIDALLADDRAAAEPPVAEPPAAEPPVAEPPEDAAAAAPAAPYDVTPAVTATDQPSTDEVSADASDGVKPDRILYGRLGVGTFGTQYALGYRRGERNHALDISISWASSEMSGFVAGAIQDFYVGSPHSSTSPYIGAGLSLANQHDGEMSAGGFRVETTAGIEFARGSALHWFTQVNFAMPLYNIAEPTPTGSISIGAGF